ncbi:hypothetical protein [Actinospica sp.]|jgi:hypothetical protein|uniref:hypothetical protein n=1 Tax=Actinospica sp. TaxID=1872142 RepID=UPI002CA771B4|nr:hypothetical protein [Actinospica sp.]HWG28082.1 hypothetical protein [Actinospica sp.]
MSRKQTATGAWLAACVIGILAGATAVASAHPPMLNPLGAANYLAQQRAGFGPPAHAAALAQAAETQAAAIRSRTIPVVAGSPNFTNAWTALGPVPVTNSFYGQNNSGRVDSAAVVQSGTNAGEIFVGTAGGGVWSSTDNGATWVTHTDQVSAGLAIGALAVDPTNPSIVYAGTGEANNCGDCFYGGGVLKSTDGGSSWTVENPGGIFSGVEFGSIAVDPNDHSRIYAGTTSGFYVSTDSGVTWSHPTGTGNFTSQTWGVALDPTTSPTTVFIGTASVGVQKSTDGGNNFTTLAGGLPTGSRFGVTQIGIGTKAGTNPTANQTLYAAIQIQGGTDSNGGDLSIYKTTDGGTTWTHLTIPKYTNQSYAYGSGSADQASYDNVIAVDPANPSHVVAAGIAQVETTDGGSTWSNINGHSFFAGPPNVIHPDNHALAFMPSGHVIIGCDGGVYEYAGGGASGMSNLNTNLNTTQFYEDLGVYNNGVAILGGLQDNGTGLYSGSSGWPDVLSGDGGYSAINPFDVDQELGEADESLFVTSNAWASASNITPSLTGANFVPPMTIVPNSGSVDAPTVYYGAGDLYQATTPIGPTWKKLTAVGSGVSAIAVAPSNSDVVYVGFDNGTLDVTTNASASTPTFTNISPSVRQLITHIDVNSTTPGTIAVSFSANNTQYFSVPPMVETGTVTLTGTPSASYTDITGNLPSGVSSNSVVSAGSAYVVATDVGVFSTSSPNGASTVWTAVGTGLPNVQVIGLSVDASGNLYAATHGRGVWKLSVPSSTPPVVTTGAATNVTSTGASLNSTINPEGLDTMYRYEYGTTTAFGTVIGPFDAGSGSTATAQPPQAITGLTAATTYYYRACGKSSATGSGQVCGAVVAFTTTGGPTSPTATTSAATGISDTGATMNGTVNAHGSLTAYTFEYGTSIGFGSISTVENGGSSTADEPVSVTLSGLAPNTTYFYRLVATNTPGTTNGAVMTFTTAGAAGAPVVTNGNATSITSTGAVLNGTVDPEGQQTSFLFEYGVGTSLNQITAIDNAGAYGGVENVGLPTGTLTTMTNYCYRIVATNATGTSTGTPLKCFRTS